MVQTQKQILTETKRNKENEIRYFFKKVKLKRNLNNIYTLEMPDELRSTLMDEFNSSASKKLKDVLRRNSTDTDSLFTNFVLMKAISYLTLIDTGLINVEENKELCMSITQIKSQFFKEQNGQSLTFTDTFNNKKLNCTINLTEENLKKLQRNRKYCTKNYEIIYCEDKAIIKVYKRNDFRILINENLELTKLMNDSVNKIKEMKPEGWNWKCTLSCLPGGSIVLISNIDDIWNKKQWSIQQKIGLTICNLGIIGVDILSTYGLIRSPVGKKIRDLFGTVSKNVSKAPRYIGSVIIGPKIKTKVVSIDEIFEYVTREEIEKIRANPNLLEGYAAKIDDVLYVELTYNKETREIYGKRYKGSEIIHTQNLKKVNEVKDIVLSKKIELNNCGELSDIRYIVNTIGKLSQPERFNLYENKHFFNKIKTLESYEKNHSNINSMITDNFKLNNLDGASASDIEIVEIINELAVLKTAKQLSSYSGISDSIKQNIEQYEQALNTLLDTIITSKKVIINESVNITKLLVSDNYNNVGRIVRRPSTIPKTVPLKPEPTTSRSFGAQLIGRGIVIPSVVPPEITKNTNKYLENLKQIIEQDVKSPDIIDPKKIEELVSVCLANLCDVETVNDMSNVEIIDAFKKGNPHWLIIIDYLEKIPVSYMDMRKGIENAIKATLFPNINIEDVPLELKDKTDKNTKNFVKAVNNTFTDTQAARAFIQTVINATNINEISKISTAATQYNGLFSKIQSSDPESDQTKKSVTWIFDNNENLCDTYTDLYSKLQTEDGKTEDNYREILYLLIYAIHINLTITKEAKTDLLLNIPEKVRTIAKQHWQPKFDPRELTKPEN